jgi:hypothetical protein
MVDISSLPPPKSSASTDSVDISYLPPPPKEKKEYSAGDLIGQSFLGYPQEEAKAQQAYLGGVAKPVLGLAQNIPYKPVQKYSAEKLKGIESFTKSDPALSTASNIGEITSAGALTAAPASRAFALTRGLGGLARYLSNIPIGATVGAVTGGLTAGSTDPKKTLEEKTKASKSGALSGALTLGVLGTAPAFSAALKYVSKAFGTEAKELADGLRAYATKVTGQESAKAKQLAEVAEQNSSQAETSASRQARKAESSFRELPGTQTATEAGRFKSIPETNETIGTRVKKYVDNTYKSISEARGARAAANKNRAFSEAKNKEDQGKTFRQTKEYENTISLINKEIDTAIVPEIKSQLLKLKTALEAPNATFEGLEQFRRFVNDRAYGLPAEGYDAIGQQMAGKIGKSIEKTMKEFSPSIGRFIEEYRLDSEKLRVFHSRVGRALTEEQKGAKGYAAVASEDIPGRVFRNKDAYSALLDAAGNNRQYVEAEAKKYFVSQLEGLGNDPAKIEKFIRDNRTMLKETKALQPIEDYLSQVRKFSSRSQAGVERSKQYRSTAEGQRKITEKLGQFKRDLDNSVDVGSLTRNVNSLADYLEQNNLIDSQEYQKLITQTNQVMKSAKTSDEAKKLIYKIIGGTVGGGLFLETGRKIFSGQPQNG